MKIKLNQFLFASVFILSSSLIVDAHTKTTPDSPIHINQEKELIYKVDANGDRVPDYSFCGYMASEEQIPNVPVQVIVSPIEGDASQRIQSAIDYVSSLPLYENGFRGTVLLEKGTFKIGGSLHIQASGVVLSGSGCGQDGTTLLGTGFDRETLIRICGVNKQIMHEQIKLADEYFPVNSTVLTFKNKHPFKIGDRVIVNRPSTKEWLEEIGADEIGIYVDYTLTKWEPGDFDINWDRRVIAVTENSITIDVPLTNSLDPKYGGGSVTKYEWKGRIKNVGIENLKCISTFNIENAKDENHRWMAVTIDNASDSWVRRIVAENFVSSAVAVWETASRITIEDCKSLAPVGEIGNYRRYSFQTLGQQVLFQRCYAEYGYYAFSVGFTAPGPNAFVQCYSYMPSNFSGAVGGWANGVLFDKMTIDGGKISFAYRDVDGQGGGWSAANSLCWQCRAAQILLPKPPGAQNWAYGSWAQGYGNGHHELQHTFINPESVYYAQLEARTGKKSPEEEKILVYASNETTAPSPELSAQNSERSKTPDLIMNEWIDLMIDKYPIYSDVSKAKNLDEIPITETKKLATKATPIEIKNGWIVQNNKIVTGSRNRTSMWRGSTRPSEMTNPNPNLVRFVPGRIGRGLTDDLDTLVDDMINDHVFAMQHYPTLWYERRRDDHARTRRADADVWAPFYEQPFSRSGQGEAFDRLSKYDLTKWNTWYWLRLKQYADLADEKGLIFINEHYLQHNIIEEGAHWADYPWRTANNINNAGFAENPHYAGDKRVYMAEEFYDTTNVTRKPFHKAYIQKCLDEFTNNTNVVHHLGYEFTGPLHFAKFWLNQIDKWETKHNQTLMIMLPGTKDVQDSILADPKLSQLVNIIDVIQWHYRNDSSLYAPIGGVSLTQRQFARIYDVGETSFDQVYRAVKELRTAYPDKAAVYSQRIPPIYNWAVFMAGGSFASLPIIMDDMFFEDAVYMKFINEKTVQNRQYILGKKGLGYIIYNPSSEIIVQLKEDNNSYSLSWINPISGEITKTENRVGQNKTTIKAPFEGAAVAWLHK